MPFQPDPKTIYWLADDDRVYSGPLQKVIDASDPGYVAWIGAGNVAWTWPRDIGGNQTDASLQEVLTPVGMFANLTYYAANVRFNRASGGVTVTGLSAIPFLTDTVNRNTINSAWSYSQAQTGTYSVQWKMSDGSWVTLSKAQLATLNNDVSDFVEKCFACEKTTIDAVNAGTITTQAQVDSAFAAVSNVYP
jgi:Domain of unknown function (DUF4376)